MNTCYNDIIVGRVLCGLDREKAKETIINNHYTHSIPSGKSHYIEFCSVLVVFSIPANMNIAKFILGREGIVWELSRLWAPDGHDKNMLTRAISFAVNIIKQKERPDALVSYADPNVGHRGGVYRAASWIYHGRSDEVRVYQSPDGRIIPRRSFHSGGKGMTKSEIESLGYKELKLIGKERFVRPLTKRANKEIRSNRRCV